MKKEAKELSKSPTGVMGLDEITGGGLPEGRPTLLCGSAGSGKTILSIEYLLNGAVNYNEPGVFMAFEENVDELSENIASLGFDLDELILQKKIFVDDVHIDGSEFEETGEYDLEGLFIRLGHAIDSINAKRVVLDTIEVLFSGFSNPVILRNEIQRLFRWLKMKGVTAIITGERGNESLTRQGLEEYVSDCVILLDQTIKNKVTTRSLRIVKYRGSAHGTNEYPFIIDKGGVSVLPITTMKLDYIVSTDHVSTGVAQLDEMLGGMGFYKGSSVLLSGTAGSGKSSMAASYAQAACRRGERVLYFAFEESESQIVRNMRSVGIDLGEWSDKGALKFQMTRPTMYGIEHHLNSMSKAINEFKPDSVIVDPVSSFLSAGDEQEVKALFVRLVDLLKLNQVTVIFTSLTSGGASLESTDFGISSLIDTWLLLRDMESNGERNRALYILKSRGMAHSNQVREFLLTDQGVQLVEAYIGPDGILIGSARSEQQALDKIERYLYDQEIERKKNVYERKCKTVEANIASLQAELVAEQKEIDLVIEQANIVRANELKNRNIFMKNRQDYKQHEGENHE